MMDADERGLGFYETNLVGLFLRIWEARWWESTTIL
jgi:hypothetical protein